jgi:hypothetical protein
MLKRLLSELPVDLSDAWRDGELSYTTSRYHVRSGSLRSDADSDLPTQW